MEQSPVQPLTERRRYWLRQHIFLCAVQSGIVFLDIKHDRYYGLCGMPLHALSLLVEGWPQQPHLIDPGETLLLPDALRIGDRYVDAGFLTLDSAAGKTATPVKLDLGGDLVAIGSDVQHSRAIRLGDIWRFARSYAVSAYLLRIHSLESIVRRATHRKREAAQSGVTFSADAAVELVCVFRRIRSFFVFGRRACLFQALALSDFLSHFNQFPTWVIGVRTDPWAAHSWVQEGNLVLDTTPELIRFYTPILTV